MTVTQSETLDLEPLVRSLKVLDKTKNIVPFEPNWAQKQILDQVKADYEAGKPTRIIVLKCRQIGISTITEAIIFCKALLFEHTEAVVASLDTEQAEYLFDMTKRFYDEWEFRSFYPPKYTSKRQLYLTGVESDINVKTGENPKAFRGRTYTDAHISEIAFWTKPVEAMNAINQGMPPVRGNFQLIESCVTGDSLVATGEGWEPIVSLVPDPGLPGHQAKVVEVLSRDGWRKTESAFVNGRAPTRRLKTKYGFSLEATHQHPLLVLEDGELVWKKVGEIEKGDLLSISYQSRSAGSDDLDFVPPSKKGTRGNCERFAPDRMTPDLAYLVGMYLAEGYASKKPVRTVITSGDDCIHDWLAETWGFKRKDEWHSWWFRRDFVDFLEYLGLDTSRRAPEKTISDRLMTLGRESQKALIQGMFDGDGTIHPYRRCVGYVTTSGEMAKRLQVLLLSFGVVARHYQRAHGTASVRPDGGIIQGRNDVHTLEISGPFYDTFMDHIGFRLERKQNLRMDVPARGLMIPGMWEKLRSTLGGYGSCREMFQRAGVKMNHKSYYRGHAMALPTLKKFIEAGADIDPEVAEYFYDPVVTIEESEAETFDLTVPVTHSFVANGIVSHNTANGMGNHFEEEYWRAKEGKSDYKAFFFPWFKHYEYIPCRGDVCRDGTCSTCRETAKGLKPRDADERWLLANGATKAHLAWRRWAIPNLCLNNLDLFKQEYPATDEEAFIASGVNAFNLDDLKEVYEPQEPVYGDLIVKNGEVEFIPDPEGPIRIYKLPSDRPSVADRKWGEYFIGADVGYGAEYGDFSAAHVINRRTKEQVAVLHARMQPSALADKLALLGKFYSREDTLPMIAVETNGPGLGTIERLRTIYPRVWMRRQFDAIPGTDRSERQAGWLTEWRNKVYLATQLADVVQRRGLTIHDEKTFKEMRVWTFYGGKGQADKFGPADTEKGHDDLVMSLGITMVCEAQEAPLGAYEVVDAPDGVIWSKEQEEEDEWGS